MLFQINYIGSLNHTFSKTIEADTTIVAMLLFKDWLKEERQNMLDACGDDIYSEFNITPVKEVYLNPHTGVRYSDEELDEIDTAVEHSIDYEPIGETMTFAELEAIYCNHNDDFSCKHCGCEDCICND